MFDLTGKVALITGARRGMGKSHALTLAKQGAKVAVTDINQEECQLVVDEIKSAGGEAVAFKMDVTNKADVDSVFDAVIQQFGRLDILVNNAGIFQPKPALELTEEDWDKTIGINLKGQFLCAQKAAKEMAKNNWGRIINIASVASGGVGVGISGGVHYTASKGGVVGMTETLADEWAPLGITVNAIGPGAIDTPMVSASQIPEEAMKAMLAAVPLKRIGKPEEVSAAVVFLASEEASYVTGATLYVDGGWLSA
ncbi:MAG: SDR family NAD(P)-dependent oxidoreductase [Candidatus Azambacteria bacterium]|nr:SDR family NAD(P)-dependent oxidoreductase [Candidatus Azambacteria bacterium]